MLRFDDFVPGGELGIDELRLDDGHFLRWYKLFPDDRIHAPRMPPGMTAMVIMRAYTTVLVPRPPGNVHGEQRIELVRLPALGDRLITRLSCFTKELKGERRWVRIATETSDAVGSLLFRGRMAILWAA